MLNQFIKNLKVGNLKPGIKKFENLPKNAKIYIKAIEEFIETKNIKYFNKS